MDIAAMDVDALKVYFFTFPAEIREKIMLRMRNADFLRSMIMFGTDFRRVFQSVTIGNDTHSLLMLRFSELKVEADSDENIICSLRVTNDLGHNYSREMVEVCDDFPLAKKFKHLELRPLPDKFQQLFTNEWTRVPVEFLEILPNLKAIRTTVKWDNFSSLQYENPAKFVEIRNKMIETLKRIRHFWAHDSISTPPGPLFASVDLDSWDLLWDTDNLFGSTQMISLFNVSGNFTFDGVFHMDLPLALKSVPRIYFDMKNFKRDESIGILRQWYNPENSPKKDFFLFVWNRTHEQQQQLVLEQIINPFLASRSPKCFTLYIVNGHKTLVPEGNPLEWRNQHTMERLWTKTEPRYNGAPDEFVHTFKREPEEINE